jgi:hypothetical protein
MSTEAANDTALLPEEKIRARALLDAVLEDFRALECSMRQTISIDSHPITAQDLTSYLERTALIGVPSDPHAIPWLENALEHGGSLLRDLTVYDAALLHAWISSPGTRGNMVYGTSSEMFSHAVQYLEGMRNAIDEHPTPGFASNPDISTMRDMPEAVQGIFYWSGSFADFVLNFIPAVTGDTNRMETAREQLVHGTDTFCAEEDEALIRKLAFHTQAINQSVERGATPSRGPASPSNGNST